jgi:hypothetical protein
VGDGEKLLTYLNSALKVLSGLDIFPRGTKKKLNFVDQCNCSSSGGVLHKQLTVFHHAEITLKLYDLSRYILSSYNVIKGIKVYGS